MFGQRKDVQAENNEVIVLCIKCKTKHVVNTTVKFFDPNPNPNPNPREAPLNELKQHQTQDTTNDGGAQQATDKSTDELPKKSKSNSTKDPTQKQSFSAEEEEFNLDDLGI